MKTKAITMYAASMGRSRSFRSSLRSFTTNVYDSKRGQSHREPKYAVATPLSAGRRYL